MSSHGHGSGVFDGINVTPLVDITLVLLIIFMVTARLIAGQSLPMDLPRAAGSSTQQTVLAVALLENGETRCNSVPIDPEAELPKRARQALRDEPALRAVIQADGRVAHARVIHIIDLLKQAGISRIAFGVSPAMPAPRASR